MFCTNCGKEIPQEAQRCSFCDAEIVEVQEENNNETFLQDNANDSKDALDDGQASIKADIKKEKSGEWYRCKKYDMPLSTASFFFMQILFFIPFVNIILLLIWSFKKNTNNNRRAYARSILIWFLSIAVILLFVFVTMIFMRYPLDMGFWFQEFKSFINTIPEF